MCADTPERRLGGFSALELMVVVSLVGLVSSLVVFDMRKGLPAARLERATLQLAHQLRAARVRAITESTGVQININTQAGELTTWVDLNANGSAETDELRLMSIPYAAHFSIRADPQTGWFTPRGSFEATNGYCRVRLVNSDAGGATVYILPGGNVGWTDEAL